MIPEDDLGPGFAYTVGLWHTYRSPELTMFGLDIHLMHELLNRLGDGVATGSLSKRSRSGMTSSRGTRSSSSKSTCGGIESFSGRRSRSIGVHHFRCWRWCGLTPMAGSPGTRTTPSSIGSYSPRCGSGPATNEIFLRLTEGKTPRWGRLAPRRDF